MLQRDPYEINVERREQLRAALLRTQLFDADRYAAAMKEACRIAASLPAEQISYVRLEEMALARAGGT